MRVSFSFSFFVYIFFSWSFSSLFAWEIKLRSELKTGNSHICLSELVESIRSRGSDFQRPDDPARYNNKEVSKIMLLLGKECYIKVESDLKSISQKELKGMLQKIDFLEGQKLNIMGDECKINSLFKKIPFQIMKSFVTRKTGGRYSIIEGEEVLVHQNMDILFEINRFKKLFFIKARLRNDQQLIYAQFPLKTEKPGAYDIDSGNKITLFLIQDQIRIRLNGRALQSGRIGDIIHIRSLGLKPERNFKARIVNRHTAEIMP